MNVFDEQSRPACLLSALRCVARLQTERVHHLVQTVLTVSKFCVLWGQGGVMTREDVRTLGEHVALQGDA